jgi:hypothetical protein
MIFYDGQKGARLKQPGLFDGRDLQIFFKVAPIKNPIYSFQQFLPKTENQKPS